MKNNLETFATKNVILIDLVREKCYGKNVLFKEMRGKENISLRKKNNEV